MFTFNIVRVCSKKHNRPKVKYDFGIYNKLYIFKFSFAYKSNFRANEKQFRNISILNLNFHFQKFFMQHK